MAGRGRVYVSGYFRGVPRQVPGILTVDKREFDEFEERFWMCHSLDGKPEVVIGQSGPSKSLAKLRRQRCCIKPTGSSKGHLNFVGTPGAPTEQVNFKSTSSNTQVTPPEDYCSFDGILLTHTLHRNSTKGRSHPTRCKTEGTTSLDASRTLPKGTLRPTGLKTPSRQTSTDQRFVPSFDIDGHLKFDGTPGAPTQQDNFEGTLNGTPRTAPKDSGNCDGIPLSHTLYRDSTKERSNPTGYQSNGTSSTKASKPFPEDTMKPTTPKAPPRQTSTDQTFVPSFDLDDPLKFDGIPATLAHPRLVSTEFLRDTIDKTVVPNFDGVPSTDVSCYKGINVIDHATIKNLTKGITNPSESKTTKPNDSFTEDTPQQSIVLHNLEKTSATPRVPSMLASAELKDQTFLPKLEGVPFGQYNGINVADCSIHATETPSTTARQTIEKLPGALHGGIHKETTPNSIYFRDTPSTNLEENTKDSESTPAHTGNKIQGTTSAEDLTDVYKEEDHSTGPNLHTEKRDIDLNRGTTPRKIGCVGTLHEDAKEGICIVILKQCVDADRQKIIGLDEGTTSRQSRVKGNICEDAKEGDSKVILNFAGKKSIYCKATYQQEGSSKHTNLINKGLLTNDPVDGTTSINATEKTSKVTSKQSTDFTGTSKDLVTSEDTKLIGSPSTPVNQEFVEIKDRVEESRLVKPPLRRKQTLRSKFFEKPKRTRRKDQNCNDIRTDLVSSANEGLKNGTSLQKKARVKLKVASSPVPGRIRASARLKAQAKANKRTIHYDESKLDGLVESFIEDCTSKTIPVDFKLCATDSGYNSSFSSCTETVVIESWSEDIPGLKHGQEENQSTYISGKVLKQSLDCKEEVPEESQSPNNEEVKIEEGSEDEIGDRRSHKALLVKIDSHCEECPNDKIVKFEEVLVFEDKIGDRRSREAPLVKMSEGCRKDSVPWQENEELKQIVLFNETAEENDGETMVKAKKEILVPATEEPPQQDVEETLNCEKISIHAGEVKTLPDFEATMICEDVTKHEETQDGKATEDPHQQTVTVETLPDSQYPATPKHEETQDSEPKWCPPGSRVPLWTPPKSPHNLIEETLYHNPWGLLVATIFLNKTSSYQAGPYIFDFLKRYPEPSKVLEVKPQDLEPFFTKIGLKKRAVQVWRMSHDFLHKKWRNVGELYGIGKYGEDAYRMFCLGDMEGVEPKDRFLKIYKTWYHMIERRKKVEF